MGNELKIVLTILAIYLVIGFQNLVNTSVFLIPYELNPLVIICVSVLSLLGSFKKEERQSVTIKFIFFIGILFYGLLASRTLSVLHNRFDSSFLTDLLNNYFTPLVSIIGFYAAMFIINVKMKSYSFYWFSSFVLLVLSFIGALINLEYLQIIAFTLYVLSLIAILNYKLFDFDYKKFAPIIYQLFLFIMIENTYFILIKYC